MDSNSNAAQQLIMGEAIDALGLREKLVEMGWVPPKEAALLMAQAESSAWRLVGLAVPDIGQNILLIAQAGGMPTVVQLREDGYFHEPEGPCKYRASAHMHWTRIPPLPAGRI